MATKSLLGFIDTGMKDDSPLLQLYLLSFNQLAVSWGFLQKESFFASHVLLLNNAANSVNTLWSLRVGTTI